MIADKYIKCNLSSGHVIRIMTNNFETYKRQLAETSTLVEMRLDMLHFFNKGNRIIIKQQFVEMAEINSTNFIITYPTQTPY